ncbi:Uncharacterised protein [Vibrio cholerae]|nr:Uncharacterised protein [Vibrio cholerae]
MRVTETGADDNRAVAGVSQNTGAGGGTSFFYRKERHKHRLIVAIVLVWQVEQTLALA